MNNVGVEHYLLHRAYLLSVFTHSHDHTRIYSLAFDKRESHSFRLTPLSKISQSLQMNP